MRLACSRSRRSVFRTLLLLLTDPAMWLLALWRARAKAMTWTPGLILDYAQTLQHVLDGRRQKWFDRVFAMRRRFQEGRRAHLAENQPTRSALPAMATLVATAMIFGLAYGLSAAAGAEPHADGFQAGASWARTPRCTPRASSP